MMALEYNPIPTSLEATSPTSTGCLLLVGPRHVYSPQKAAESQRLQASRKQFVAVITRQAFFSL